MDIEEGGGKGDAGPTPRTKLFERQVGVSFSADTSVRADPY